MTNVVDSDLDSAPANHEALIAASVAFGAADFGKADSISRHRLVADGLGPRGAGRAWRKRAAQGGRGAAGTGNRVEEAHRRRPEASARPSPTGPASGRGG
ncbi:MAG: hypothetical protein LBJ62_11030 [Bifidobacteriaceae bacterium]|nr:hypothetical protein [Bifidobacteriaceae bacterium]